MKNNYFQQKRLLNLFYLSLWLFGFGTLTILTRYFNISFLLDSYYIRLASVALAIFTVLFAIKYSLKFSLVISILLIDIFIMATFNYNGPNFVYGNYQPEIVVFSRFFLFVVIGYNFIGYVYLKKFFLSILLIGIIANVFGIIFSYLVANITSQTGRTLAYELQIFLVPSFLLIFQLNSLNKRQQRIVIFAFTLYAIEQLLFLKRLPIARIMLTLLVLGYFNLKLEIYKQKLTTLKRNFLARFFLTLSVFLLVGTLIGINFSDYSKSFIDRFTSRGSAMDTYQQDERWELGATITEDLKSENDLIIGRGLGGVVFNEGFNLETKDGQRYRNATEMGFVTIMLKGGYTLLTIIIVMLFLGLRSFKYAKISQIGTSFWGVIFIWTIFMYFEGFIGSEASVYEIVIAYSLGALMRISSLKYSWLNEFDRMNNEEAFNPKVRTY